MRLKKLLALCECAIFTAMAIALSYLKIPIGLEFGGFGGSILAGGTAVNWQSMLLDYSVAYMCVGLAGLLRGKSKTAWLAALIGCFGRFVIHFISGITIYAEYVTDLFGLHITNPWVYSVLYNGSYMLPNTILAVAVIALLSVPLGKYMRGEAKI